MLSDGERRKLTHIRENIALAMTFAEGRSFEQFREDPICYHAVTRALEIISEASRALSGSLKARHPEIPWQDVAGSGSVYRHDYEDVSAIRIWRTVHEALPILLAVVDVELPA